MRRRSFFATSTGAFAMQAGPSDVYSREEHGGLVIERPQTGHPHKGKVLAAIQPHSDDLPIFAAGTISKLLREGYTGHLIRITNDDMAGPGTVGETVLANERDNQAIARTLGLERTFDLNYNNHWMDSISRAELRCRLVFIFRLLKVDTVITYDPWGHYEENPDHYVSSDCIEAACWTAGGTKDYPEHFAAGLAPHSVREKYYFARFQQRVNRIVDTSAEIEHKIDVLLENKAQGPAGDAGAKLRARLAKEGMKLPLLGNDDTSANRNYIRQFVLERDRQTGAAHSLAFAEPFHYIGPVADPVETYIRSNAIRA